MGLLWLLLTRVPLSARLISSCFCLTIVAASSAFGQNVAPAAVEPPAIRRWLDVQSVLAAMRYRFTENSVERVTVSDLQWQTQFRGRFLFDKAGRYHVGSFVTTGPTFRSGWVNTGAGLNRESHSFKVRQLWFGAAPAKAVELQIGGLPVNRGEMADVIASDNDSFIIGERATVRPTRGPITQVSLTAGRFDAVTESDFFKQIDDAGDLNYAQALVGVKIGPRVVASVDYTYEDGRDILREGLTVRVPASVKVLTSVRVESYQRVDPDRASGFNVAADLRMSRLAATVGVMSTDRHFGPFNGDRYELGSRYYYSLTYPLTPELSLNLYQTRAFGIDFPITIRHRFDFVATYNPTALLKRKRVL